MIGTEHLLGHGEKKKSHGHEIVSRGHDLLWNVLKCAKKIKCFNKTKVLKKCDYFMAFKCGMAQDNTCVNNCLP